MGGPINTSPSTSSAQRASGMRAQGQAGIAANLVRINHRSAPFADLYHFILDLGWGWFLALIVGGYVSANLVFAALYTAIPDSIAGSTGFWDNFFFSVQTWATIGYGQMTPKGPLANAVVVVESMTGIFGVAMLTGLLFSKFSRPSSRILFAEKAVINHRDGKRVFLFRAANERGSFVVEADARVTLLRDEVTREGDRMRRLLDLPLVRAKTPFFVLSWTVMHEIDASSPLFGMDAASFLASDSRIAVSLMGYDSTVGQTAHANHVYQASDVMFDYRYIDATHIDAQKRTVLDYAKFHQVEPIVAQRE